MHPLIRVGYEGVMSLADVAAAIAPEGGGKTRRALRARRGIGDRYRAWGDTHRDSSRPLLWVHAPSVGEGLQARPILEALRASHPSLQLAYTYFSPSAESFAGRLDVDFRDYLPFDRGAVVRSVLDSLRPDALIFSKLDLWPVLAREASRRGTGLGMISATVAATSGRSGTLATALLHDAYATLDAVGAVSDEDASRLVALGVRAAAVSVTGDTRYDQVWARAARAHEHEMLLGPLRDPERTTLVAGSTWPADEAPLLEAWSAARTELPGARLILAPHEPDERHLAPIAARIEREGWSCARLGDPRAASAEVILVDRVGVLGELYAVADLAYVGGGFHAAGLHSVLEPAAYGVPVLFGPRHRGSRDAGLLLSSGGAVRASSAVELRDVLLRWMGNPDSRAAAGNAARETVRQGLGATSRSVELVERLLDRRTGWRLQAGR